MQQLAADYTQLDDPDLFEERRHVRERLQSLPARHAERARLTAVLDALTTEFDRRARAAWQPRPHPGETRA
jgi:hypothetical protein